MYSAVWCLLPLPFWRATLYFRQAQNILLSEPPILPGRVKLLISCGEEMVKVERSYQPPRSKMPLKHEIWRNNQKHDHSPGEVSEVSSAFEGQMYCCWQESQKKCWHFQWFGSGPFNWGSKLQDLAGVSPVVEGCYRLAIPWNYMTWWFGWVRIWG